MNLKRIIAVLMTCMMFSSASAVYAAPTSKTETINKDSEIKVSDEYESFDIISEYISQLFIDDTLTKEDVMKKGLSDFLQSNPDLLIPLLKKTFESVDDYSEFFTAQEYQDYLNSVNQIFYGIGVTIQKNGDYVEITGFSEENGLAQQTGFMVGDKIYAVDGEDCKGKSLNDVRNLIVGQLNTKVNVTVLRDGELIDYVATRIEVRQNSVTGGVFEGDIGYMRISTFGDTTSEEFKTLLDDFREKKVKKIIIDLRNNGGGRLDAAVAIAKQIIPKGKIIDVVYRNSQYNVTYTSDLPRAEFQFNVLVNENTASSSEILASSIQDSGAGKLVGTNTYGKAVVQNVFPLTNGMKFKLTIAQYKTRNGKEINNIGLEPDEYVVNTTKRIDTTEYKQFDFRTRWAMGDNGERILAAKERLAILNYYPADAKDNPVFDEELKNAIAAFQTDNGLCASGVLDIATQVKLEEVFESLETVVDLQLQTAYEMFGGNPENLYAK